MDNVYRIVPLANGAEAKVRPASPHIVQGLYLRVEEALPPKPELPVKQQRSVDGHTEETLAQEGDPEYETWKKDYAAWNAKADAIKKRINGENLLRLDAYAVIGWRKPVGPFIQMLRAVFPINWFWNIFGLGWQVSPPKGWKPASIANIPDKMDDWDMYILTELISATSDYTTIERAAILPLNAPITQEEVERQLDGFPPDS